MLIVVMGLFGLLQLRAVHEVAQEGRLVCLPRAEAARVWRDAPAERWARATRRSQTTDFRQLVTIARDMTTMMEGLRKMITFYPGQDGSPDEERLLTEFRKLVDDYEFALRAAFQEMETGEIGGGRELLK